MAVRAKAGDNPLPGGRAGLHPHWLRASGLHAGRAAVAFAWAVLLLGVVLAAAHCVGIPDTPRIVRVVDGDTVVIQGGEYVRYIGIDTPEKGEPFYEEATACNRGLIEGKTVRLETDVTNRDRYDRLLRYVYVGDLFVNLELVRQGYAEVYPRELFPDNKHYDLLKQAEDEAKQAGRGIWG